MKKLLSLLLCLCLLTGCGMADKDNIINLLSSPGLSRDQSLVMQAIKEYLGLDVILKYPRRGDNALPVQMVSLDGGEEESRVVLYTAPSISANVRMAVLERIEDRWHVVYEAEGYGTEVYKVEFANLTGQASKQIIVAYTFRDLSEKLLSVYFTDQGRVSQVETQACQDFEVYDITGDGVGDLVSAGVNADNQRTRIRVFGLVDGELTEAGRYDISVPNAVVTNLTISENDFSDRAAVVVDYRDSYSRVYTLGVYFDSDGIKTILTPDTVQKIWRYQYDLVSRDVDGDGYLETPTVIEDGLSGDRDLKFMEWTCFVSPQPQRKYFGVCLAPGGIYMPLPDEWQNYVTISFDEDGRRQIRQVDSNRLLMTFRQLGTGERPREDEDGIIVSTGTLQVYYQFSSQVSADQRQYITEGLMSL